MSQKDIMESYEKVFLTFREPIRETRASARQRLVWFVGIAGYATLNAKVYWEALGNRQFLGIEIFWLSLPWALSAFLSVITHFVIDEAGAKDDLLFTKKLATIDLYKIGDNSGKASGLIRYVMEVIKISGPDKAKQEDNFKKNVKKIKEKLV